MAAVIFEWRARR